MTIAFLAKTGFDIFNAFDSAAMKSKQADLTRQLADLNKKISDQNAFEYLSKGLGKANAYKSEADQQIGQQNVAYAYADVDTSFGTARMVQDQSRLNSQFNMKQIEDAAYAQALGEKQKGLQYYFQGEMAAASYEQQAKQMITSAIIKGAADTGLNWKKLKFSDNNLPSSDNMTYDQLVSFTGGGLMGNSQPAPNMGLSLDTPQLKF